MASVSVILSIWEVQVRSTETLGYAFYPFLSYVLNSHAWELYTLYIGFWMFLSFRIIDYNVFFRILDEMIGMFSLPEINEKKVLYALNFRGVFITIIIFIILSLQFHHLFFGTSQMLLPNSWLHLLSDADISKNHIRHK